jgi:hypothetical protein
MSGLNDKDAANHGLLFSGRGREHQTENLETSSSF